MPYAYCRHNCIDQSATGLDPHLSRACFKQKLAAAVAASKRQKSSPSRWPRRNGFSCSTPRNQHQQNGKMLIATLRNA